MKRLQKIEDVDQPEVGSFYLVPCVEIILQRRRGLFWLVIGTWHEDAKLGVPKFHFHHDVRFYTDARNKNPLNRGFHWGGNPAYNLGKVLAPEISDEHNPPEIVYRRMRMLRPMPDFPMSGFTGNKTTMQITLEDEFKGVQLNCLKCPHRGMSLKGLPVAADGTVICNGHGLKWNLKTGRMVKR